MIKQSCGNCGWWKYYKHFYGNVPYGEPIGDCEAPRATSVARVNRTSEYQGTSCPCWKERE